jgi:oligoendopeptidase F
MGDTFDFKENDGYAFVSWSHIRRFFYVYSYAYGQLISRAFFENWKKNPKYIEKIDKFLSAGGSKSPKDIFLDAGIDITDPKFFEAGLRSIEKDIDKLEKLAKV